LVVAVAADAGMLLAPGAEHRLLVRAIHDPGRLLSCRAGDALRPEGVLGAALRQDSAFGGLDLAGLEHAAAVALRSGDVPVVLAVGRAGQAFTTGELETLELIGSVAALALRNAELFSAAKSASLAKSEFLNMAAHELRTPLSVISGYVSLLSDGSFGAPDARWLEVVSILNAKAAELSRLVDSLLTAARLESSEFGGRREPMDLVELASDALRRAEPRARLLQATVLLDAPGRAVAAEGDVEQIGRIVDNLIDNALTYAGEHPWVRVSVDPSGRIEVEDSGPGIPDDLRDRVFERFYRINDSARAPQPGTGLGLYIARELAERNGGSLEVTDSSVGTGARFVLQLAGLPRGAGRAPRQEHALEPKA
jgi:signal transduction histidine kinase